MLPLRFAVQVTSSSTFGDDGEQLMLLTTGAATDACTVTVVEALSLPAVLVAVTEIVLLPAVLKLVV